MRLARVAIPRPNVETAWDYLVPGDLDARAKPGVRALVPVGGARVTGYITGLAASASTGRTLKPLLEILDDEPLLSPRMLELTRWVADYYISSWGDVIKAALPAGINVVEREVVRLTESGRSEHHRLRALALVPDDLGETSRLLDHLVERGPQKVALLNKSFPAPLISRLLREGWIGATRMRSGRKLEKRRKAVRAVESTPPQPDEFWRRSPKRKPAYERLLAAAGPIPLSETENQLGASRAVVDGLVRAGLAEYASVTVRRDPFADLDVEPERPKRLVGEQRQAFSEIEKALKGERFSPFLLHGVTGSGKTEIYIHAAGRCLESGKGTLILIPELALTPQFVRRYYAVFGDHLAVLHSALSGGERIDEWNRVRRGEAKVVLGTRLSVFAPLENPGLIVVDEEHDSSYKQDDYPTFSARDVALVRAQKSGCVCVLGSATPSLESLHNTGRGKYRLLRLKKRVFERPLPRLNIVDLRSAESADGVSPFPGVVDEAVERTLQRGEQTLVLVGRKGYAPFVLCRACGHNFECPNCSIGLAYHEAVGGLKCHYCGRRSEMPRICPECGSGSVEALGTGTEKVEEQLLERFPDAAIERMDRDVITNPRRYREVLERLRKQRIDILVGTQMIAKGHDYPHVTTVVALGLDSLLRLPDFRHCERVFQLITQISGRAGRGERPGEVFILTYRPDHYAVRAAGEGDWELFLEKELDYRARLRYPPFGYLALLTVEDRDRGRGRAAAQRIAEVLYGELEGKAYVLGPSLAPYARLKSSWRHQLIIKAAERKRLNEAIRRARAAHEGPGALKTVIDPVSVM